MKRDGEAEAEAEAEAGGDDFVHVAEAAPAPEDGPLEFSEPPATRGEEYVRALEAALTTKSDESGAAPLRGLGLGKIKIAAIKGKTTMLALLKKMKREDFPSHRKNRVGWLVALLSLCDTIDAGRAIKAANTPRQLWEYRKVKDWPRCPLALALSLSLTARLLTRPPVCRSTPPSSRPTLR